MVTCAASGAKVTTGGGAPGKARLAPNCSVSSNIASSVRGTETLTVKVVESNVKSIPAKPL